MAHGKITAFGEQHRQLATFSIKKAQCFCCSVGHVHPETQAVIECDRHVIEASVVHWFGQLDTFDAVLSEEFGKLWHLEARLSYRYVMISSLPFMWDAV
eukprot:CAMPEP_0195063622 /NCGR_PEP_ID=MMETSP0448-20130528/9950_1 /TAXON_ID=66468 /ORGANISM="Heterocapsa triquestra, Strain CCMP 448" /LENGTH=98 /DNA_ID=CAMNT_0040094539 /DNA_START=30 /DNA_END=323 /DNA_ORIENTATION=+